ncbi:MAG: RNA 2',3'-cyclic phosphodiesterase [Dehalococcoidales bacterium]|nr:RNA 2',3'-cyclic phosphodiesterase [Dehalococcoidales bacterium]
MEQLRSFIAIELPDELKLQLSRLETKLKKGNSPRVKWVNPTGIHLTLKFLGNITTDSLPAITKAIEIATRGIAPFRLQARELGGFPNLKRTQVVWVGIDGEINELAQLQQRIESNLVPLGFAVESRRFSPHLTLARLSRQASSDEQQRLGELIGSTPFNPSGIIEVTAVSLMQSQLTKEGARYNRISLVRLSH